MEHFEHVIGDICMRSVALQKVNNAVDLVNMIYHFIKFMRYHKRPGFYCLPQEIRKHGELGPQKITLLHHCNQ